MPSNKERLDKLLSDNPRSSYGHALPKIQRVQSYLRDSNSKYFSPRLVSIGPIHHFQDLLQEGEKYKTMWAAMYLEDKSRETVEQLLQKIVADLLKLKELYTKDVIESHNDEDLAWIFFLDGCAVLYLIEKLTLKNAPQQLMIKTDQWINVLNDLILLENQLPFQVFKLLSDDEPQLLSAINKFFTVYRMNLDREQGKENNSTSAHDSTIDKEVKITVDQPTHLLHLLYNRYIGKSSLDGKTQVEREGDKSWKLYTHRNIQELKASGIRVKKIKKKARHRHINFETSLHFWGRLFLPTFIVNDFTVLYSFNMYAFEMCPDFKNNYDFSSYMAFLDSLIDNVDDVKELRKAGVLFNMLGSDEEVTKLFNNISTDLRFDVAKYQEVRNKMEDYYISKKKTMAQAWYKYFSNPWSFFAFLGAIIALILTFIQTWFAIYPSHNA